jgi:hypothetical protein
MTTFRDNGTLDSDSRFDSKAQPAVRSKGLKIKRLRRRQNRILGSVSCGISHSECSSLSASEGARPRGSPDERPLRKRLKMRGPIKEFALL